jgi:mono/diheme cytochrome c family protein
VLKPMFVLLTLFLFPPSPPQTPAGPTPIPADAATLVNPVKPTAESQAHAKKMYGYDCAMCHGVTGDGKGDLVADLKLSLKDLTDLATLKDKSDGELFYIIKNGRGQMPPEGDRGKPEDLWNMVIYVRSLAKK